MSETKVADCRYCKMLLTQLDVVVKMRGELDSYAEWESLRSHLVKKHADELPSYLSTCPNCQEWRELTPHVRPNLLVVLAREAALHRAGHRIVADELPDGGLRVGLAPLEEGGAFMWA